MAVYPFNPHKVDTGFNEPTFYGPHEGRDYNGPGGGNTDCGYDLNCICSGTIIHTSKSSKNYGNLTIIETTLNGVTYYVRYCHSQDILYKPGDHISLGQLVCHMGSTGNSTACHLHLDILKKKPPYWRFYSKNVIEWFIDPDWFIKNYKEDSMNELLGYLDVQNNEEAKKKLKDHLGEKNKKINWGAEGDQGGYLGSERAKTKRLSEELKECQNVLGGRIDELSSENKRLSTENYNLKDDLKKKSVAYEEVKGAMIAIEDERDLSRRLWNELSGLPVATRDGVLRASDVIRNKLRGNEIDIDCFAIFKENLVSFIKQLFKRK